MFGNKRLAALQRDVDQLYSVIEQLISRIEVLEKPRKKRKYVKSGKYAKKK